MDSSGSPKPVRLKPGPASRTRWYRGTGALYRSPGGSNITEWAQPNSTFMPAPEHRPPRSDRPMEILRIFNPLYSPAPGPGSSSRSSIGEDSIPSERLFLQKTKTSCLLCSDPLLIEIVIKSEEDDSNVGETESSELSPAFQKRFKAVKDLCHHLQFNPKDIPSQYSEEMFPFCGPCQHLVETISASHRVIQEETRKISESVQAIERKVADAELLGTPRASSTNQKKFMKLREVVLNGYRNKLIMKKKVRESLLVNDLGERQGSPAQSTVCRTAVLPNQDLRNQVQMREAKNEPNESEGSAASHHTFPANFTIADPVPADHPILFSPVAESENSDSVEIDVGTHADIDISFVQLLAQSGYCRMDGTDEDDSALSETEEASLEISDVRSMTVLKLQPPSPVVDSDEDEDNNYNEMTSHQDQEQQRHPDEMSVKKRRAIYQGVEIYRISNDTSGNGKLQCGLCGHAVQINETSTTQDDSAYQSIISHIKDLHIKSKRAPKRHRATESALSATPSGSEASVPSPKVGRTMSPQRNREFVCSICPEKFKDMYSLVNHRKLKNHFNLTSPTPPQPDRKRRRKSSSSDEADMPECDICLKPVTFQQFLRHRYSHKNLEEKLEAILTSERGAPSKASREYKALRSQKSILKKQKRFTTA